MWLPWTSNAILYFVVPYNEVNLNVIVFVLITIVSDGNALNLKVRAELTNVFENGPFGNGDGCDLAVSITLLFPTASLDLMGLLIFVPKECTIRVLFLVGVIRILRMLSNLVLLWNIAML